jgi:hypothetical protein
MPVNSVAQGTIAGGAVINWTWDWGAFRGPFFVSAIPLNEAGNNMHLTKETLAHD